MLRNTGKRLHFLHVKLKWISAVLSHKQSIFVIHKLLDKLPSNHYIVSDFLYILIKPLIQVMHIQKIQTHNLWIYIDVGQNLEFEQLNLTT